MFAAKTATAAGLAWVVAPLMPGPAAAYPYYAPLGVLVSMHPTVAASAKHGLQSLLGLLLGIGMAFGVAAVAQPSAWAVALVVGLGILVGGLPRLGSASEWVPMAALFVLVLGGSNAEGFSIAYVLQMALGVGLGFAVNWLVFPPLHLDAVEPAFAGHQRALAQQLEDMAQAMVESWPPDHEEWASRTEELEKTASEVRQAVKDAELSAKANPRSRRRAGKLARHLAGVRSVERLTFHVEDVTDVLASAIWEKNAGTVIPGGVARTLSDALEEIAELVNDWREETVDAERLDKAKEVVAALSQTITDVATGQASVNAAASVAMSLRRIITVIAEDVN